jgi:hypothetical protein
MFAVFSNYTEVGKWRIGSKVGAVVRSKLRALSANRSMINAIQSIHLSYVTRGVLCLSSACIV